MALLHNTLQLARRWMHPALRGLVLILLAGSAVGCGPPPGHNQHAPAAPTGQTQDSGVHRVNPDEFADGPAVLRGSNSAWRIGAVPVADPSICSGLDLYLLARPPTSGNAASVAELTRMPLASLALASGLWCEVGIADSLSTSGDTPPWYDRIWQAPRQIGVLTITDVQDVVIAPPRVAGTVMFTTTTGLSGTFDLAAERWELVGP